MKKSIISLLLVLTATTFLTTIEARRRCGSYNRGCGRYNRGGAAVGFFAGALSGAALAGAYNDCRYPYYGYGPRLVYAYDYPAFSYSPVYAYPNTVYTYPGFYFGY